MDKSSEIGKSEADQEMINQQQEIRDRPNVKENSEVIQKVDDLQEGHNFKQTVDEYLEEAEATTNDENLNNELNSEKASDKDINGFQPATNSGEAGDSSGSKQYIPDPDNDETLPYSNEDTPLKNGCQTVTGSIPDDKITTESDVSRLGDKQPENKTTSDVLPTLDPNSADKTVADAVPTVYSDSARDKSVEQKTFADAVPTLDSQSPGDKNQDEAATEPEWTDILGNGKLKKKIVKEGDDLSIKPRQGQIAQVIYAGKLKSGGQEVDKGLALLNVMEGDCIQALDLIISTMAKGEVCEVESDAIYCWGEKGKEPEIPANADMNYLVQLTDIQDGIKPDEVSAEVLLEELNRKKTIGNIWLRRGDSFFAINSYTKAIQMIDARKTNNNESTTDSQRLFDIKLVLLNNLAQAALKNGAFERAVEHAGEVLKIQPENEKALWRMAKGLEQQQKYKDAKKYLDKLCKSNKESKLYKATQELVNKKLQTEKNKEKKMYSKMFNLESSPKDKSSKAKESGWLFWALGAGIVAILGVTTARFLFFNSPQNH